LSTQCILNPAIGALAEWAGLWNWYVLQTRSNFEKRVVAELGRKGLETYLPLYHEEHQWKDRRKIVEVPLFGGYIFVRIDGTNESKLSVLRTTGVVRILGQGDRIEPVPDAEIDSIRMLLSTNVRCFLHPFLKEGAWVRVKKGPLRGVEGQLVRFKGQARLVLSVSLLARSVATEVDVSEVESVRTSGAN
jgi:transcription antitermination factor NusG